MNLLQKTTKTGKPIINRLSGLPEFERSVYSRLQQVKQQLGFVNNKPSNEQRWDMICTELSTIN